MIIDISKFQIKRVYTHKISKQDFLNDIELNIKFSKNELRKILNTMQTYNINLVCAYNEELNSYTYFHELIVPEKYSTFIKTYKYVFNMSMKNYFNLFENNEIKKHCEKIKDIPNYYLNKFYILNLETLQLIRSMENAKENEVLFINKIELSRYLRENVFKKENLFINDVLIKDVADYKKGMNKIEVLNHLNLGYYISTEVKEVSSYDDLDLFLQKDSNLEMSQLLHASIVSNKIFFKKEYRKMLLKKLEFINTSKIDYLKLSSMKMNTEFLNQVKSLLSM